MEHYLRLSGGNILPLMQRRQSVLSVKRIIQIRADDTILILYGMQSIFYSFLKKQIGL